MVVSLIHEIHKIKNHVLKTQDNILYLTKALALVSRFIDAESNRLKKRGAVLHARISSNNYPAEIFDELANLNETRHSIEKMAATFLRYLDADQVQPQPVVQPDAENRAG